jgi:glycosyltransferase involved in cell wall biosynthesis
MNILQICHHLVGHWGNVPYNLSLNLSKKGLKVIILTMNKPTNLPSNIQFIELKPIVNFNFSRDIELVLRLLNKKELFKEADVIHVHQPFGIVATHLCKVEKPLLYTLHGLFFEEQQLLNSYPGLQGFEGIRYKIGSRMVFMEKMTAIKNFPCYINTLSTTTKLHLMNLGIDEKRLVVIPNGYNELLFKPMDTNKCKRLILSRLGISKNFQIISTLCEITPLKGIHDLIFAFNDVLKFNNNVLLLIAGPIVLKGYYKYLLKLLSKLKITNRVFFIGYISPHEVPVFLNGSDVFTLCSYSEGAPLVVPEALGCNRPILVSTSCAPKDYGLPYELTFKPGNIQEISSKLKDVLTNNYKYCKYYEKLYNYAIENLTWSAIAEKHIKFYEKILYN